jgi:hypothetical protein
MDETRKKLLDTAARAPTVTPAKPLASDLIWEVEGIAEEVGLPVRVAYHLLRTRCRGKKSAANGAVRGRRSGTISRPYSARSREQWPPIDQTRPRWQRAGLLMGSIAWRR